MKTNPTSKNRKNQAKKGLARKPSISPILERSICAALMVSGLAASSAYAATTIGNDSSGGSLAMNSDLILSSGLSYVTEGSPTFNSLTFFAGGVTLTTSTNLTLSSTNGAPTITATGGLNLLTGGTVTTGTSTVFTVSTPVAIDNMSVGSVISGSTGLTKTGNGTLTLSGANTYAGITTVSAGTLAYGANNAILTGAVTVSGGTLNMGAYTDSVGAVTINAGATLKMAASQTATVQLISTGAFTAGGTLDLTGMSNAAGIYKIASGTSLTNTFTTVTGLDSNYVLRYGTVTFNELDAQHKATINLVNSGNAANVHLGSQTVNFTIANSAPTSSTTLNYTLSGVGTGSGTAVAGAAAVGFTGNYTAVAGPNNVSLTATDLNATTTSQTVSFTQTGYRLAAANAITPTVTLTNVHVGGTFVNQALTITNTAANDTFSEKLDASFGVNGGLATNNAGTIGLLAAQSTDSASLTVGLGGAANTGVAGAKTGTVTVNLTSDGAGTSGLGTTALTSQNVTVSGGVYNLASATIATPINLGNVHVGGTFTNQALTITNTGPAGAFTEKLGAAFGGTTGVASTNGGAINLLAAQSTDSATMTVGFGGAANTGVAGAKIGTVTVNLTSDGATTSGLANTALTAQTLNLSGAVYNLASANTIATPVNLGFVHVGGSFGTQALSVQNTAPNAGFSEKLDASFGANGGLATNNAGTVNLLTAQSTDNASLVVGLGGNANTATAGTKTGTVNVNLVSDGVGTSGLANTSLGTQTVAVTGGVFSGQAEWNNAASGNWLPDGNWKDTQSGVLGGAPGLAGVIGDTATFGTVPAAGVITVNLNGNNPVLAGITFNNANASYVIAAGGGGALTLNNGAASATLGNSAGSHTVSAPVTLASNLVASLAAGSVTISGIISESGGSKTLQKSGNGTLMLTGANTYTGATTVNGGILQLNTTGGQSIAGYLIVAGGEVDLLQSNQIKTASTVTVTSGVFSVLGFNNTVAGVSLQGGSIQGTGGTLTSASDFDVRAGSVSAILGGAVGLTKTTAGTVMLTGVNAYTGLTDVKAGTLELNTVGGVAVSGNLTIEGGTVQLDRSSQIANAASLIVSSGALNLQANSNTVAAVQLTGGSITGAGTLTSTGAFDLESGNVSAILAGNVGATKTTVGTVTLTGANTYTGMTDVQAGTLLLNTTGAPAITGDLQVSGGLAMLDQSNEIKTASNVTVAAGSLAMNSNNNTVTLVHLTGGSITGPGTLTSTSTFDLQSGNASAVLAGNVGATKTAAGTVTLSGANTYTGLTNVQAGTLLLNTTGAPSIAGDLQLSLGVVQLNQSNQIAVTSNVTIQAGTLAMNSNNNTVASVHLAGGSITGPGTLTSTRAFDLHSGNVSAVLAGNVGATKTTIAVVTLTGANTYTGLTDVQAGTLILNTTGAPAIAGDLQASGGIVQLNQSNQIATTSHVSVTAAAGQLAMQGNNNTVAGVQLTNGGSITGNGTLTSSSAFDLQQGVVSAHLGGAAGLVKSNVAGQVNLNNSNTFTGSILVSGGTLLTNAAGALGTANPLTVQTNGILDLGTTTQTVGAVTLSGGTIQNGTLTTTGVTSTGGLVSAKLAGAGGLTHNTGTLTLTGANTYTGLTDVQSGSVVLNSLTGPAIAGDLKVTGNVTASANNQLSAATHLSVTGGAFALQNFTNTVAGVQLVSGAITGAGTLTSTSAFDLQAGTVGTHLAGAVGLTKSGAGTVTLQNTNSYTGPTVISGGLLQIAAPATLGAGAGSLTVTGLTSILDLGTTTQTVGAVAIDSGGTVRNGTLLGTGYSSTGGGTVSAILGGAGGLTVNSGGLLLTGANTYTGATHVAGGTLEVGDGLSGSIQGNSPVTIDAGGTLQFHLAVPSTIANTILDNGTLVNKSFPQVTVTGKISGSGKLIQDSPGVLNLTAQNTYTGSTEVKQGILKASNLALPKTSSVSVDAGATLTLAGTQHLGSLAGAGTVNFGGVKLYLGYDNTAETFSGTFNGTPTAVYYDSTSNWTVTSASVPFNAVLLNTGLVLVNAIQAHGTGLSALSNFTLQGSGASSISTKTWNGFTLDSAQRHLTITSTGEVVGAILVNQGLLTIDAGGNLDGPLTLSGGEAAVNGTVGQGATIGGVYTGIYGAYVGQNAYLHGNGTILGDLINAGRLSPGNSPGTLHINGNFTQTSTGTLVEDLQSATVYDRLIVKKTATLGGNVQLNYLNNFKATAGESFTILTAGGGVTGKFNLIDPHATGTLLSLGLVYQSNDVLLTFVQGSFAGLSSQFTLTPNQLSVARGLDNLAGNQPKSGLIAYLDNLKLSALPTQLEALSPSGLASIFEIGIATESVQSSNIQRRLQDIRNGATGFSSSGANITDSHGTFNFDSLPLYGAEVPGNEAKYTPEGKGTEAKGTMVTNTANNRWGTFIAGSGEFTKINGTSDVKGSDFTTGGVTLGLDYRVSKNLAVGAMAGYANTSSGSAANGAVDVNGGKGGVYATWFNDGYYVDSSFTLGGNSYDTTRDTVGGTARGSTSGLNWNGLIGGGYDRKSGSFSYGPVASVQYTHVGFDQFTETGSLAALTFPNQSEDSLRTQAGMHGSYIFKLGSHTFLTPDVRVQWQHEFMDSTASLASRFAGETSTFTVSATQLKRDSLWVDAGATLEFSPAFSVFAYYTGDVGRTNYSSNAVSGGVRINF